MADLLALADDETRALWDGLALGYTESTGHPLLRARDRRAVRDDRAGRRPHLRRRRGGDLLPHERHRSGPATTSSSRGPATRACTRSPARPAPTSRSTSSAKRTAGRSTSTACARRSRRRRGSSSSTRHTTRPACCPIAATLGGLVAIAAEAAHTSSLDEVYRGLEFDADRPAAGRRRCPPDGRLARRHVEVVRAGRAADRLAGHAATATCSTAARGSRTTRRSARRRPRRSSRSSAFGRATRSSRGHGRSSRRTSSASTASSRIGPTASRWVRPRAGSIGFPRLTVPGVTIDDWAAEPGRGRGRPAPARLAVRPSGQPLPDRLRPDRPARGARPPRGVRSEALP